MTAKTLKIGFVFPLLTVLAAVAWLMLYHFPTRAKINKIKNELIVLENKVRKDVPENRIQAMQKEADSLVIVLQNKENRIYPMQELVGIGGIIQPLMKSYNLALLSLKPKYESLATLQQDTAEIAELPIAFELKGRFHAFAKFMDDINKLNIAMKADELTLVRENREATDVNIEIKGVVFLKKARVNAEGGSNKIQTVTQKT